MVAVGVNRVLLEQNARVFAPKDTMAWTAPTCVLAIQSNPSTVMALLGYASVTLVGKEGHVTFHVAKDYGE